MDLHPDCEPLAFLLGTWRGKGDGEYPSIDSFAYMEEVTFGHVGKPFLIYTQKTRHAETGEPLHAEMGYLRVAEGTMNLSLVQPTGILETYIVTLDAQKLTMVLDAVSFSPNASPAAKSITDTKRTFEVDGDVLRYTMGMAAVGNPMTHHLRAELHRVNPED